MLRISLMLPIYSNHFSYFMEEFIIGEENEEISVRAENNTKRGKSPSKPILLKINLIL